VAFTAGIIGPFSIAENIERQSFGSMEYDVWADVIRTNTFAPLKMAEAFLEHVAASDQKKIVNISSTVGSITEMTIPGVAYASSKSALNRAMTIVASQVKDRGVIVAMYCPGYVKTRMDAFGYAMVEIPDSIAALRPMIADLTIEQTGSYTGHDGRTIGW
jgi:NAD(P)-dependent dehydrogenase (short-subunit alcohol dehydrogenase family)